MGSKIVEYLRCTFEVFIILLVVVLMSFVLIGAILGALFGIILTLAWNSLAGCLLSLIFIGVILYWLLR